MYNFIYMSEWSNLPDNVKANIFRFLSTPTADIIRNDVIRQYTKLAPACLSLDDWREYYCKVHFAEQCMDDLIQTMTRVNSLPISYDIKCRFIIDFILPLDFDDEDE